MPLTSPRATLQDRLATVNSRIGSACAHAGRAPQDVRLVAVTKSVSAETAALLPELGIFDLGESRPQELWRKAEILPRTIRWHQIGHLQRNKIERTLLLAYLLHSVDSLRLLEALEIAAGKGDTPVRVLLEVNASAEANKHGFPKDDVPALAEHLRRLKHVQIEGLMTMAAFEEDPEKARPTFACLRELRDQLRDRLGDSHPLRELSMGMTNDFEIAIAEGATIVRIGTALFTP